MKIGMRTIEVSGEQLLLNGKPVLLRGFGKHEDFSSTAGASICRAGPRFRAAEMDRRQQLPHLALSLFGGSDDARRRVRLPGDRRDAGRQPGLLGPARDRRGTPASSCCATSTDLVERDRNHPCVIMWSVANEPMTKPFHTVDEAACGRRRDRDALLRIRCSPMPASLDDSRPVALVSVQNGPAEWVAPRRRDLHQLLQRLVRNLGRSRTRRRRRSSARSGAARPPSRQAGDLHRIRRRRHRRPARPAGRDVERGLSGRADRLVSARARSPHVRHRRASLGLRRLPHVAERPARRCDQLQGVFTRDRRPKLAARVLREAWAGKPVAAFTDSKAER